MKKSVIIRKIWDDGIKEEEILGYKYNYGKIYYAIYNCKDYNCQYNNGYVAILTCDNEKLNGLAITKNYKTLKETVKQTMKVIDEKEHEILEKIGGCCYGR